MGIIEQLQYELQQLRREFEEFKQRVSDYISQTDDEIRGHRAAAKFTGVSVSTMERLVREDRIAYKKDGKSVSFSRHDLIAYKRSRRLGKSQPESSILNH